MARVEDILILMRDDLLNWMFERGYGNSVYIVEEPVDELAGQYAIQIIPDSETPVHPNSGVGLMRVGLSIVVWWRGFMDSLGSSTERISGDTGVQGFTTDLREYLVQRSYTGMVIPIVLRSAGTIQAVTDLNGWITMKDGYDFAYEMNWTVK